MGRKAFGAVDRIERVIERHEVKVLVVERPAKALKHPATIQFHVGTRYGRSVRKVVLIIPLYQAPGGSSIGSLACCSDMIGR